MVIHATPTNAFATNIVPQQHQEYLSRKFNLEFLSSLPRIAMRVRLNFSFIIKAVHQTPFTTAQPRFTQNHHCDSMVHYRQPTLTIRVFRGTFSQQKLIDSFYDIEKRFI